MKIIFCLCMLFFSCSLAADQDFDMLMGKKTKHWRFISQEKDIALLEFAKKIYEENKHARFSTGSYKIPPIIHFIWLGPKHFPPQSVDNVRTWIAQNPGWKIKLWTDRERMPPCEEMEVVHVKDFSFYALARQFAESENWGEKSDILRYEILFQEGGVYVDHDANCLQSFDGMHKGYDFYCGLEAPHEPFVGCNLTCGNGVIGSRPHHPTVKDVIEYIARRWDVLKEKFRGNDPYSKIEIVMQRTYIALTHCLMDTVNREGNTDIVLPAGYFFAKSDIPSVFSKHFYATSWDNFRYKKSDQERSNEKIANKLMHEARSLVRNMLMLIGFNIILMFLVVKLFRLRHVP